MANPFPGMDPYLEGDLWTTVHTDLCAEIARQLSPRLRPKYRVLSTRRVVPTTYDVHTSEADRYYEVNATSCHSANAANSAVATTAPMVVDALLPEPIPHTSLEIHDTAQRRLVTCIELLLPTNKRGSGREEYAAKRLQILSGPANLMEIDLLRAGTRYPTVKPLPSAPYFVFVCRPGNRKKVELHPMALEQPLLEIPVPLLEGDRDVMLDLQHALRAIYDIFAYDALIDYSQAPVGPLSPEQTNWIEERLTESGRRT